MRPFIPLLGVVLVLGAAWPCQAQEAIPLMGNRDQALVAATPGYRFYSDFWTNLHQYLYGIGGGGPEEGAGFAEEVASCIDALGAERAGPWREAVAYYRETLGALPHRRGFMRAVRYRLSTLGRHASDDPRMPLVLGHLRAAAPAYRACLWDLHDTRNRARIGDWVSMLVRYAPPLQRRLSIAYRGPWPGDLAVDVVSYVSYATADTETGIGLVDHVMVASTMEDPTGFSALETLLHEPGHILFGPFHGTLSRTLQEAADQLGVEPPDWLWHAIMFYTSGELVRELAASQGVDYTPYWIEHALAPEYEAPIREHWQPYLDGEVDMMRAALDLVRATTSE
ncbi:MAG: hypothetical protein R3181_14425 [Rubricoccaceae bacterium]|nr:hypothetical protein [Rubricoccaceae bacterium]